MRCPKVSRSFMAAVNLAVMTAEMVAFIAGCHGGSYNGYDGGRHDKCVM